MKTRQMVRRLLLLPALAALLVAACGEDGAAVFNGDAVAGGDAGPQEIRVLMYDNYFEPAEITVRVGAPVTFIAENVGIAMHNLVIRGETGDGQDFMSDILLNPSQEITFEETFTQPGTYEFKCSLHLPGMVGTLTVE